MIGRMGTAALAYASATAVHEGPVHEGGPAPRTSSRHKPAVKVGSVAIKTGRYTPGGPNRNCGHLGISPKRASPELRAGVERVLRDMQVANKQAAGEKASARLAGIRRMAGSALAAPPIAELHNVRVEDAAER